MKNKVLFLVYIVIMFFCLCSCSDKKYLEKAAKLANEKEYQAAVSVLEKKIHVKDNPKYLILHGLCCSELKFPRYRDAVKDFKALLNIEYEKDGKILFELANWSFHINEFEDTVFYAQKASEICDDEYSMILWLFMADSYYNLGKYDESLRIYSKMINDKEVTSFVRIDYNKVLSILNNHDYLSEFWKSINWDEQSPNEKENLIFYYAKALLEIGKIKEALQYFESVTKERVDKNSVEAYKIFCLALLDKTNVKNDECMYIKDIEEIIKGNAVVFLDFPNLELIKLSALYFYLMQDFNRFEAYCRPWVIYSKDIPLLDTSSDIDEFEMYFKNDRLFKLVKNMKCNYL